MVVPTSGDPYTKLRRKAEAAAASYALEGRAGDEQRLARLIREVRTVQTQLELRNRELVEKGKAIDSARENYARLYEKYANLYDFAPNGYLVLDHRGYITDTNQTAATMLNVPKAKLTGRCLADFIQEDDRKRCLLLTQECRQEADTRISELNMVRAGGGYFTSQVQIQAFSVGETPRVEYRVALVDISEKVRFSRSLGLLHNAVEIAGRAVTADQLLREIAGQIKTYVECDAVGIRVRDAQGYIPYQACEGFDRAFYESENRVSLQTDHCMCIQVIRGRTDARLHYFTENGSYYINGASRLPAFVPTENTGNTCNLCNAVGFESIALVPIIASESIIGLIHVADRHENKVPLRVVEVLENVGLRIGMALQRFHMQDELSKSLREVRELSSHLIKVQENEQRRIAMELHDQTGQDLNVLKLRIKAIQNKLRKDQPGLKEGCGQVMAHIDKLIDDVRRMSYGLNPASLESLGLGGALRQMARELAQYSPLKIKTSIALLEQISDPNLQAGLFRIIQEALTNSYKHARATAVTINAIHTVKGLQIVVRDNGQGFEMKTMECAATNGTSMGLATMHLRARMIGARLAIAARPGQGTRVKIVLPAVKKK